MEPRPQRWEARVLPLCHHGPEMPSKARKMTAVPPASNLDELGHLFESQSDDASGDVDIFDEFSTPEETGPPIHAKLAGKVINRFLTNLNNKVVTQKLKHTYGLITALTWFCQNVTQKSGEICPSFSVQRTLRCPMYKEA